MGVSTIKPGGGGDYTTLALWGAAKSGSSSTEDALLFAGNCGVLNVGGWNPPSSTIAVDPSAKHTGVDNGTAGIAFSPKITVGGGASWRVRDLYLTRAISYSIIAGGTVAFTAERCLISNATNTDTTLFKADVQDDTISPVTALVTIRNCVLLMKTGSTATAFLVGNITSASGNSFSNLMQFETDNNSCYAETSPANGLVFTITTGDISSSADLVPDVQNTAIFGPTVCFPAINLVGPGNNQIDDAVYVNDASSDATADDFGGSGHLLNQTASAWFRSLPTDLRLQASSPGQDAGFTLGGFSDDIIGTTRPQGSAWDIGAFETVVPVTGGILGWLRIF